MPKVCHIIHESRGGGGMTFSLTYFPRYRKYFETIAITGNSGPLPERLEASGVRTHPLPLQTSVRGMLSIPAITAVLRREQPDLVIVHGQWGGFCGAVAAWIAGVRRVLYYTQMPAFYTDWDFYRILRNRFVEVVTCALADRVICLSAAGRYQYLLRHLGPEEKFLHIPNGVDPEAIRPVADKEPLRRHLQLPTDGPLVVSVARLEDQKCMDWLITAWSRVQRDCPEAHLVIVGDGRQRLPLERLATGLGLSRCHFVGVQPEAWRYFQAADVGVITSMFEGHPLSLLEAMAAACPVVGTNADGVSETIRDGLTGYVVPVANSSALAAQILNLLHHPEVAQQMGQAARERILQFYSLDSVLDRQLALAKAILQDEQD